MQVLGVNSKSTRGELHDLLRRSDFISLNCLLTPATRNILSTAEFAAMRDGAVLINCSRAGLIDRAALEAALDSGRLGTFALDVHWEEPCSADDPLLRRRNVIATPHFAGVSQQFFDRVAALCLSNVAAVLCGEHGALLHCVPAPANL